MEECLNMVLDETCLNHEDFLLCLLGKVKEFASLINLKVVLGKEGYVNIKLKYMGGFWVMIVLQDDETKKRFQFNLAVGSWFSQIIQAYNDFVIDERVIWVKVKGVPCKWWSRNTFSRIASRWGMLLNGKELEEEGYHSNRICIRTKLKTAVFDSFKMVYRGMTCWVHAIEVPPRISKEDDVQKISTSVFVTNFPDGYGAKDLWNTCKLYGHVVDVFIPDRRTKAGKKFGFVRFIKVLDIDCLINNLCTVWVRRNKIHANVARFQRESLHKQSNKVNNKGTDNVNHGEKGVTNSYAHVVKGNQVQNVGMEECPNMVLNETETCLNHEDFSLCLLGKVMIVFQDDEIKKRFQFNLAVGSWFSQIIQAHNDFVIDERVIWVKVEGVPCKWWSRNTFSRIASRWGTLLNGEELEEEGYHSNRICIRTKLKTVVFDSFKMMYRGMTCWVHAIEVPGWVPDFEEDGEEGYDVNDGSHEDDMHGGVSENLTDVEGESDREEVPETNFEEVPDKSIFEGNSVRQNDVHSEDPFEKVDNWSDENRVNDGQEDGICVRQHVHERVEVSNDTHESTCFGHFKKLEVPRKGGSILELIDDLVNVG
nr:nucleotide-binding alpha-beta plait domain-containing protein [Tanacetum cinerariifolium]